jgi:predicted amidohydrolase
VFVYWGEGLNVSQDGVKLFDTDFGRIALLTCFDFQIETLREYRHRSREQINEARRKGAKI